MADSGSERVVDELGLAEDVVDDGPVSAQGAKKSSGRAQDVASAALHEGVVVGGRSFDEWVLSIRSVCRVADVAVTATYVSFEETDRRWERETGGMSTWSSGHRAG